MDVNNGTLPKLLVVGGNGFIGRHIVMHAYELGWQVTSLSLNVPVKKEYQGVCYLGADISDKESLSKALTQNSFDYVVNCGGYIDHSLYSDTGRNMIDCHFTGVLNLVEIINKEHIKTFINIGSSDEYGDLMAPQNELKRESPISPYSLGKLASTHFLQMLWRTENFPSVTLRLFLTYGPGQNYHRFLPQIIKGCLDDNSFPVSAGEQLRDFCYIKDTVIAIFTAMNCEEARGEVINIASGQPVAIRSVIATVRKLIGKGDPKYGEIAYRSNENMELYADISKAKALLNWEPKVNFETGLRLTIQWVKHQYEG
jgi:nucleoside-diphosphate-sugar epimerase